MSQDDRKLEDLLPSILRKLDIDTVFGLMGDANMYWLSSYRDGGGRYIPAVHESNAFAMADGYSRVGGRIGVVTVTHGPGLTNVMTALTEAVRSRSEVLLVSGDPPLEPTHFQQVDIPALAGAAGAGYERVYTADSLVRDVNRSLQRVIAERRPVVLNIPSSVLEKSSALGDTKVKSPVPLPPRDVDPLSLDGAVGLIANSVRPIILAGRGSVLANARDELIRLADLLGAGLATTLLATGYFEGHSRNVGLFGNLSHPTAAEIIGESDCVIAFGASLNAFTSFHGEIFLGKGVIQIDEDPARLGWYTSVDEAIAGDARTGANCITSMLEELDWAPRENWARSIALRISERDAATEYVDQSRPGTIDVRTASRVLDTLLPRGRVIVSDIGRFVVGTWPYLSVDHPADFVVMGGFGSIGLGLGGAMGASVAAPDKTTVVLVGDGGFMMSIPELMTAVRERLPLCVVVFNDNAYGAEHYRLVRRGIDAGYAEHSWPDIPSVARALGAQSFTVRSSQEMEALGGHLATRISTPIVIDVRLDPTVNTISW